MRHQINNTNCVSFISLTVTVKHVVGEAEINQVLPQWICLRCNIQVDNMGSEIFFECTCDQLILAHFFAANEGPKLENIDSIMRSVSVISKKQKKFTTIYRKVKIFIKTLKTTSAYTESID